MDSEDIKLKLFVKLICSSIVAILIWGVIIDIAKDISINYRVNKVCETAIIIMGRK